MTNNLKKLPYVREFYLVKNIKHKPPINIASANIYPHQGIINTNNIPKPTDANIIPIKVDKDNTYLQFFPKLIISNNILINTIFL